MSKSLFVIASRGAIVHGKISEAVSAVTFYVRNSQTPQALVIIAKDLPKQGVRGGISTSENEHTDQQPQSEPPVCQSEVSDPSISRSNVCPKSKIKPDLAAPPPPSPQPFHPNDDYCLRAFSAENFVLSVSSTYAGSYLVSFLDDSAVRQLIATCILLDAPVAKLISTLNNLFDHRQSPALTLEAFWSRRLLAAESADAYVGVLLVLALEALPDESPTRREAEILKRFTLGIRNTELYSKFIRKQYTSSKKALEMARAYLAADVPKSNPLSPKIFSVSEPARSTSWLQPSKFRRRETSPA
ncbi:hypothetical protein SprV_0802531700 [Sparganum proliferum]